MIVQLLQFMYKVISGQNNEANTDLPVTSAFVCECLIWIRRSNALHYGAAFTAHVAYKAISGQNNIESYEANANLTVTPVFVCECLKL